ncbi:hypothetical protein C8R46DRAFT_1121469 [Mycena filopes]|nr:hypothetical protein C8R46DRAFT_1121469 [Mycena filopes]
MPARPMYKYFGVLLVVSLALFFGLFFGLNYPEIVKHGWPLTRCTVLSSEIVTRYCCETSCQTGTCQTAPSGSPGCSGLVSSIDSGYSPSVCAANSSACPTQAGSVCDGGCACFSSSCGAIDELMHSMQIRVCSNGSCTQSCTSYQCNCYCCSSTNDLYCTLSCPICYDVDLQVSYSSRDGVSHNNVDKADSFFGSHTTNSTSFCYYNPKDILFNVGFTAWKWGVFAAFGALPLLIALGLFAFFLLIRPAWNILRLGYGDMVDAAKEGVFTRPARMARSLGGKLGFKGKSRDETEGEAKEIEPETDNPPPAYKPRGVEN